MSDRPFSTRWMLISLALFVGVELLLGGLIGGLVGGYMSLSLRFLLQGALNLASYFIGGIIIGVISPGVRIHEPAVGALLAVAFMLSMSLFTPYSFIQFSAVKLVVGGAIAFVLALTGAKLGERMVGHRVD
ncbi:hypothetical protein ACFL5O_00550 [Myxococcota bacterium]